eukprot:CAMPEP_0197518472 /NCGR_PEP_ID=MMETSP1318-20131121/3678_1 /TAXON_ID=552666 /ORGANISM="Partenskyella glossopodia, Strain RCC365" /LENGTH=451 /DNA_ID=CAMNT_0043068841 /DNA_START=203 /DNA_END=1559 /DNA_ORIENTATION=-
MARCPIPPAALGFGQNSSGGRREVLRRYRLYGNEYDFLCARVTPFRLTVPSPGQLGDVLVVDERVADIAVAETSYGSDVNNAGKKSGRSVRLMVGVVGSGEVLIYRFECGHDVWQKSEKKAALELGRSLVFMEGSRMVMSGDGNTLAVVAGSNPGRVVVFEYISGHWVRGTGIEWSEGGGVAAAALNENGKVLALGSGVDIQLFEKTTNAQTYEQIGQPIHSPGIVGFGRESISLSDSGRYVVIGSINSTQIDDETEGRISVKLYEFSQDTWKQLGKPLHRKGKLGTENSVSCTDSSQKESQYIFGPKVAVGNGYESCVTIYERIWQRWYLDGQRQHGHGRNNVSVSLSKGYTLFATLDGSVSVLVDRCECPTCGTKRDPLAFERSLALIVPLSLTIGFILSLCICGGWYIKRYLHSPEHQHFTIRIPTHHEVELDESSGELSSLRDELAE